MQYNAWQETKPLSQVIPVRLLYVIPCLKDAFLLVFRRLDVDRFYRSRMVAPRFCLGALF